MEIYLYLYTAYYILVCAEFTQYQATCDDAFVMYRVSLPKLEYKI